MIGQLDNYYSFETINEGQYDIHNKGSYVIDLNQANILPSITISILGYDQ